MFKHKTKLFLSSLILLNILFSLPNYSKEINQDEKNVRNAFLKWTTNFNNRDVAQVCDLFSHDLIWVTLYPSYKNNIAEKNYEDICAILKRTITDKNNEYQYSPQIKEVILAENHAIVRVVWTLKTFSKQTKKTAITKEYSLDIMKKGKDGTTWKMTRFVAYEVEEK